MNSNIGWKVGLIIVITALAVWAFYPPQQRIRLGLDLKGGVHLVLRVQTDDALKLEAETVAERIREALAEKNIPANITVEPPTRIAISGVPATQDAEFRSLAEEFTAEFDRSSGAGGSYTYTIKANIERQLRDDAVKQAQQTIERRVNELGVAEPNVALYGTSFDQILVQLPGVTDVNRAKEIIRSTAMLELKIVEAGPMPTKESLLSAYNGTIPSNMDLLSGAADKGGTSFYLVRKAAGVTGRDLRSARPSLDENNRPAVSFSLNSQGAQKFGKLTQENIGRQLAIVLDGRVQSAPVIESRITDEGRISGTFTQQEVADLGLVLRSGALPASLTYLEERTIGPSLGADSIRSGIVASLVGLGLVVVFMLIYYKLSGINAIVALVLNLIILLGLMAYIGATMTLPGIAGFVLTIGIGVDSNVLIFERIKEELRAGKGVRASVDAGFGRVFLTLLDTHIASLISAAFLFNFGTGPIRGFATTLTIGLLTNLFTSTFVSKTIYELVFSRQQTVATLSI